METNNNINPNVIPESPEGQTFSDITFNLDEPEFVGDDAMIDDPSVNEENQYAQNAPATMRHEEYQRHPRNISPCNGKSVPLSTEPGCLKDTPEKSNRWIPYIPKGKTSSHGQPAPLSKQA